MGQGGYITLVNGTTYDWTKTKQQSNQMNTWNFPQVITARTTASVYVEWGGPVTTQDEGRVTYTLGATGSTFDVLAVATNGFALQVSFTNLETNGNPQGTLLNLGWNANGSVEFILSGVVGNFNSSNIPTSWMQTNLSVLGKTALQQLCIPGSHDAGMSTLGSGTGGSYPCNTVTQTVPIAQQLLLGVRYFDIRPVITGGNQYMTGHYSKITKAGITTWQGGNGQSIDSIIYDVNAYTDTHKELIILHLSHDLNTTVGNTEYRALLQSEWNPLFTKLGGINDLWSGYSGPDPFTFFPLNSFIENGPAVVVVIDPSGPDISLQGVKPGIFPASGLGTFYNVYSNKNDATQMATDQLYKLSEQKGGSISSPYFVLSWTLTQSPLQAAGCLAQAAPSILDLAATAKPLLYSMLLPACHGDTIPNIIYIDNVDTSDIAALAMAINFLGSSASG